MPSGFETYSLYVSLKNHFSRPTYDYFRYNGKINAKYSTFERRSDRYFFEKLGKRYPQAKLIELFVANFIENPNLWIGDLLDGQADETYTKWLKKIESLTYHFSDECDGLLNWLEDRGKKFNDIFKVVGTDHPIIVKMTLQGIISIESFIILDKLLGFCERVNKKLDDPIWENFHMRMLKYAPFLELDLEKCKRILRDKIETEHTGVI